ncbi:MAG: acetyl-CoA carboxylase biotin carboxyl carrier protein subunit [Bacteroidetes bacterium HGW-Bacteroidetes-6]|jgi:biotin carboxyl carrier protein|nr:MAG: acetyl-CoA carboxylase biotin carboxyl carrier protein subunit [Bacteroidetes bacterium HGW-Bacteroidetes-6]
MKKFAFTINGNKYDVEIGEVEEAHIEVNVNGTAYDVEVDRSLQPVKTPKLVRQQAVPSTDASPQVKKTASPGSAVTTSIKSPLPGVIMDVHVKEGDTITFGQKLLTLEAMKMENVINSDKEGVVKSIKFHKGDNVMEGDVLVEIGG